jgi:hypothetical protein
MSLEKFEIIYSYTRKQALHPPLRHRWSGQLSPSGVRGGSLCAEQCSTARCRRIYERCAARIEGAGRSSPCPPEAVMFQVLYVSGGQGD